MEVVIGGIVPVSTMDFEGHSASVVFFGGCNFKCPYCYDYNILDPILAQKTDTKKVFDQVMRGRELITGVVFSGGEPTIQPEPLMELCRLFKKAGLAVKIDTNGTNAGVLAELLARGLVDWVALDVKAPLSPAAYAKVIGVKADKPVGEIKKIFLMKKAFKFVLECRTTVVPELVDSRHQIMAIAREVAGHCDLYVLQQFVSEKGCLDEKHASVKPPSRDALLKLAAVAKKFVKDVRIRTAEFGEEKA